MKMKNLILVTVLLLIKTAAIAQNQESVKEGGYTSFEEFKGSNPKFSNGLIVEKRSKTKILMWGGPDYIVESITKDVTGKIIKNEIWGVFQKDTLYLNTKEISGVNGFAKVELLDTYSLLRISIPTPKYGKKLGIDRDAYLFGGGAMGGAIQGGQLAAVRIALVYNFQQDQKWILSKDNMLVLLDYQNELKSQYMNETDMENQEVLIKYLKKLNEVEANKI